MASMATFATIASLAGTAVSAIGTIAAGRSEQKMANYEAASMEGQAKDERAAAQREAFELQRKKKLALSQLQARAAGSGFMATDPTVLDLAEGIGEYGEYQSSIAQYGGDVRAEGLRDSARARRYSGAAARKGSIISAVGQVLSGAGNTMFDKYGGGGFEGRYANAMPSAPRIGPMGSGYR